MQESIFGKIIKMDEGQVRLENVSGRVETSLVGVHIIFEDKYKIVGEISSVDINEIGCTLIGEIVNGFYQSGLNHKPTANSYIRTINKDEVTMLVGNQDIDAATDLYIGKNTIYEGFNVSASMDDLFSNHFAIIGNSGSGKSCTVTRIFQNLFYRTKNIPTDAHIALFDVYGEYHTALDMINRTKYCRCKYLTTNVNNPNSEIVKIPPYFLEVDDLALLLNAGDAAQLPLIEKALKYVYLFTESEDKVIAFKNNIIAKAVLDVLTSGRAPVQIRDQVVAVLTTFNTKDISLESEIVQPGYTRTLRQCLNVDATGKINTIQLVTEYMERYINDNLKLDDSMKPRKYTLKDLYSAFEFALISEGVLKSDKIYDRNNMLKVRLDNIINGDYGKYFEVDEYISKEDYIHKLFTTNNGEKVQIINFNLNYVDERFAKIVTKLYAKLFLNYSITLGPDNRYPIHIVIEEAHRYVQNDNDINVLGYNIFDRITKEGRKYGVLLGLITQRPSELSTTSLSQCSNYIILRMFHPDDLRIIKSITHSITEHDIEKLKYLTPGVALCFGNAFHMPVFAKIDKPNPLPTSTNVPIGKMWFKTVEELSASATQSLTSTQAQPVQNQQ